MNLNAISPMIQPLLADSAIGHSTSKLEGLSLMIVGMAVVFIALVLVGQALVLIRRFGEQAADQAEKTPAASTARPKAATPTRAPASTGGIDPRTLAVLTAAAAAVVGGAVRIRRVQFLRGIRSESWASSGRAMIHNSHNIQQRKR